MTLVEGKLSIIDIASRSAEIAATAAQATTDLAAQIPSPLGIGGQNLGIVDVHGVVTVQFKSKSADDVAALIAWLETLVP